tara:strand:+ start:458 stop:736 length:279 start_codon:yes stop_codon:yes gene_type:complete
MDNSENLETKNEIKANNLLINDPLEVLLILLEIGIERGLNLSEMSAKTQINKHQLYRYTRDFNSQETSHPNITTLSKVAEALGYEIRLVKKN